MKPCFIARIPDELEQGVLYISEECQVAIHLCPCGCGEESITPFYPNGWDLIVEGDLVSLHPSIGNWYFPCRSHYWIKKNEVIWDQS